MLSRRRESGKEIKKQIKRKENEMIRQRMELKMEKRRSGQ